MSRERRWGVVRYFLFAGFLGTAILNLLRVRGGFLTNHAADLIVPAWLYVIFRGLGKPPGSPSLYQRTLGRSPAVAASSLFVASTLSEVSQLYWPRGIFAGVFDPLDIVAFGVGLLTCYLADRASSSRDAS